LLYWLERTAAEGFSDLLLAPIKGADDIEDKIYQYLKLLVAEKEQLEVARLLYVAATRARKQLHLLGSVAYGKDGIKEPNKRSLLATLWSAQEIRSDFQQLAYDDQSEFKDESQTIDDDHPIRRLPLGWTVPEEELISPLPQITTESIPEAGQLERVEFDWASETARHIGTLVHRYLQRIAKDGLGKWDQQKITALRHAFGNVLLNMGVPKSELKGAVVRVDRALNQILIDERGGWILSAQHQDARSEYALSSLLNGKLVNVIIDRTFIDASGYRWIIDYKTGMHSGSDIEEFLDREQERYCKQLERYAAIFRKIEDKPIRLGLYFPLMSGWRSWDY
jgi:ATP-dependent exoDNAse (exonuclease V) beta subunit